MRGRCTVNKYWTNQVDRKSSTIGLRSNNVSRFVAFLSDSCATNSSPPICTPRIVSPSAWAGRSTYPRRTTADGSSITAASSTACLWEGGRGGGGREREDGVWGRLFGSVNRPRVCKVPGATASFSNEWRADDTTSKMEEEATTRVERKKRVGDSGSVESRARRAESL